MKFVNWFILSASLLTLPTAFAGPNDGGGGKGVVCRDKKGNVKSVELLDLWEAREIYERQIIYSNDSFEQQLQDGILRLKHAFAYPIKIGRSNGPMLEGAEALADSLLTTAVPIHSEQWGTVKRLRGKTLTLTEDSFEEAYPEKCKVEQLIQYKDVGLGGGSPRALMNQDLVDQMDTTNKVALALHEALYAELRKFGETNSIRTRRAVGFVMAGGSFKPLSDLIKGRHIVCESKQPDFGSFGDGLKTRIYIAKQSNGLIGTFPEKIGGMFPIGIQEQNSGTMNSIEAEFEELLNGGSGHGMGGPTSPVDFDLGAMLYYGGGPRAERAARGDAFIQLVKTVSGFPVPYNETLRCKLVD